MSSKESKSKRRYYLVSLEIQKPLMIITMSIALAGALLLLIALFLLPPVLSALSLNHSLPTCNLLMVIKPIWPWMLAFMFIFLTFFYGLSIYVSHKVGGPFYAFESVLRARMTGEDSSKKVVLREDDLGHEFAKVLNEYLDMHDKKDAN